MLKISQDHMTAFRAQTTDQFVERGVKHLRTHLPEQTDLFSDDDLRARIRAANVRARTYGFRSERHIMAFVDTGFLIGPNFETDKRYPWASAILANRAMPANQRAGMLLGNAERASHYQPPTKRDAAKES